MTKTIENRTSNKLAIIAAFLCGKLIQFKSKTRDVWMDGSYLEFDFINFDYRIEER
jgi:hypothetical protein